MEKKMKKIMRYYKNYGARKTVYRILSRIYFVLKLNRPYELFISLIKDNVLWNKISFFKKTFKVSIIVPNYNHADYLKERLDSIYNQTYKNFEVILLDDCSTDSSYEILKSYQQSHQENTTLILNEKNSENPFEQWLRGMEAASGDLIWLAESDDWCEVDFLEKLLPAFEDEAVLLAYCNTVFMEDGEKIWDLNSYLGGFNINFNTSFMMTAHDFVRKVMFCKNPIANASSAIFRKQKNIPPNVKHEIKNLRLCGDWLFYLYVVRGGIIAYIHNTKNYYRIHKNSTSLKIQQTLLYYEEQYKILKHISSIYKISNKHIDIKYKNIISEYISKQNINIEVIHRIFDKQKLYNNININKINIGICGYSFTVGGGEIFPIHLANALKQIGCSVTYFDFNFCDRMQHVRDILSPDIPVVISPQMMNSPNIMKQLGIDILHTHHGSIDSLIFQLGLYKQCHHVVTLHGFYESIDDEDWALHLLRRLKNTSHFVYVADKNIDLLQKAGIPMENTCKIANGLPMAPPRKLQRASMGIGENDFVLCLASRALPSKGWKEAVEAVNLANAKAHRPVHLLLLGEGEMYDALKNHSADYIHVLGNRWGLEDYYALADMGLFPSRYLGESFPLVNIECLLTGTPIIASNIGDIKNQLTTDAGHVAGAVFELDQGSIPVARVAELIVSFADSDEKLRTAARYAREKSKQFDILAVARQYLSFYTRIAGEIIHR